METGLSPVPGTFIVRNDSPVCTARLTCLVLLAHQDLVKGIRELRGNRNEWVIKIEACGTNGKAAVLE